MADKQEKLQQLMELKSFYEQGFMSKEEFDKRRIEIIDGGTGTKAKVAVMAGESASPQVKKDKNPVYADRHFDRTQADSLKDGEYVVVAPPTATNKHLYTGAAADSPFSYVTAPVAIDPNRGKAEVTNAKRMDDTTVIYAHTHAGGADRDQQVAKLEEDKKKLSWELFYAASVNDVPRIKELLDRGADINQRDFDTEATPIIVAGARGQKHAVYYMVERGAEVNAQNARGETVLHEAVKLKFNEMALWLVKHGADIHLENFRGYSGYDLALPWLQKELKDERDHYLREQKKKVKAAMPAPEPVYVQDPSGAGGVATIRREPKAPNHDELAAIIKKTHETDTNTGAYVEKYGAPITKVVVRSMEGAPLDTSMRAPVVEQKPAGVQEVLKIYLKNGSYKCIVVTSDHTAKDLADSMAEKINMSKYANYFDIIEVVRGQEKRLDPAVNILAARKKWPLILGPTGNETELNCRFVVVPKRGTPDNITMMYRDAIYGGAK